MAKPASLNVVLESLAARIASGEITNIQAEVEKVWDELDDYGRYLASVDGMTAMVEGAIARRKSEDVVITVGRLAGRAGTWVVLDNVSLIYAEFETLEHARAGADAAADELRRGGFTRITIDAPGTGDGADG